MQQTKLSLYSARGERKYLNEAERLRFLECTKKYRTEIRLFCQLIYYTGARISEIYNLKTNQIDFDNETVIIETLKKRKKGLFREFPPPPLLLDELHAYIKVMDLDKNSRLWRYSLRTASRYIKRVMNEANITGIKSSAKGLRHGFAVNSVRKIPLPLVKKWMGHTSIETTEIYLDIMGVEEREFARLIW